MSGTSCSAQNRTWASCSSDSIRNNLPCANESTSSFQPEPFNSLYLVGFVARPLGSLDLLLVFVGSLVDFGPLLFVHFLELCEVAPADEAPHHREIHRKGRSRAAPAGPGCQLPIQVCDMCSRLTRPEALHRCAQRACELLGVDEGAVALVVSVDVAMAVVCTFSGCHIYEGQMDRGTRIHARAVVVGGGGGGCLVVASGHTYRSAI